MAKYYDNTQDLSFTAAVNLSSYQYHAVTPGSVVGEVTSATGASNPAPFGILQNAPSAGQEAKVRVYGVSKLFAKTDGTCALGFGKLFTFNASGQGAHSGSETGLAYGRWLDATVAVSTCAYGMVNFSAFGTCALSAS